MNKEEVGNSLAGWIDNLWADDSVLDYLREERGLSEETIEGRALGYEPKGYYGNSVVIPYYDSRGGLRTVRFRRLEGKPKYDQFKGEKAHLYNVAAIANHRIHIAEGEFDTMVLEQLGYPAVGIQGVQTFKEDWRWLFSGSSVRFILDSDMNQAGQKATLELARVLEPYADDMEVIELPIGEDVSSLFVSDPNRLKAELEVFGE